MGSKLMIMSSIVTAYYNQPVHAKFPRLILINSLESLVVIELTGFAWFALSHDKWVAPTVFQSLLAEPRCVVGELACLAVAAGAEPEMTFTRTICNSFWLMCINVVAESTEESGPLTASIHEVSANIAVIEVIAKLCIDLWSTLVSIDDCRKVTNELRLWRLFVLVKLHFRSWN